MPSAKKQSVSLQELVEKGFFRPLKRGRPPLYDTDEERRERANKKKRAVKVGGMEIDDSLYDDLDDSDSDSSSDSSSDDEPIMFKKAKGRRSRIIPALTETERRRMEQAMKEADDADYLRIHKKNQELKRKLGFYQY
jgi:hypothetical protein